MARLGRKGRELVDRARALVNDPRGGSSSEGRGGSKVGHYKLMSPPPKKQARRSMGGTKDHWEKFPVLGFLRRGPRECGVLRKGERRGKTG